MQILSQRDPRWANVPLGASKAVIGRYGCTITSIAMLSDYFGCIHTPELIAQGLAKFTNTGLLKWQTLQLPCMAFEKRLYGFNEAAINESLQDPNKAVILQVQGYHWVVALGKNYFKAGYRIADPWFGDKATTARYANQITGSAHFVRK